MATVTKDVEMKDAEGDAKKEEEVDPKQAQKDKDLLTFEGTILFNAHYSLTLDSFPDIREQMKLIEKGVNQKEPRYIHRATRCLQALRKRTNDAILRRLVTVYYPPSKFLCFLWVVL